MQEIFPIAAGFIIGLGVQQLHNPKVRTVVLIVLCLIFGFIASFISGELAISWGFLTVDAALVWLGAAIATGLAFGWRRRSLWLKSS
jgi:hypothetical protein